ncbi:PREDICTED: glutathione S-transferase C-terminal domain-containing protein homolog [Dinoponera quadriceps]|uniref:Glutathione S-transferase C-terminal domain-containing protein homolog n=1 Tax=Dinoponera quadriceps TaxID=609295 RepID=A0A6P3XQA0_DINQU|nr:PREDICTED: glutathione S-transferase C-terminal domain-containing protein homolog [Dinoponera quadriceps]
MHKDEMYEVYLSIYSAVDLCLAPIETLVTLFTMKYCESLIDIKLIPSKQDPTERAYKIDLSGFVYEIVSEVPHYASSCELPCLTINKFSCVSSLCIVLRQIIQEVVSSSSMYQYLQLLGFRFGSLKVSSETCAWTKFCEVDLISTLKHLDTNSLTLPTSLARFECHMSKPIRLHNKHSYPLCKELAALDIAKQGGTDSWEHEYVEAVHITLPDIIIFVCMHMLLSTYSSQTIPKLVPLTVKWYDRMLADQRTKKCISCLPLQESHNLSELQYTLPAVVSEPLYNSSPKRYKRGKRIYTKQEDIEHALQLVEGMRVSIGLNVEPFGAEVNALNWTDVPYEARPESGHVPVARCERKREQLQNLCKAVLKLAKDGDTIVDFCSGSGHLGILVAYLLPRCKVILMENKDKPVIIARRRVEKLKLTNVRLCHGNFNRFKLNFDLGMSLHACGVATDLVIQSCIEKNAIFVCCPCCYGSVQDCHRLTYPRSDVFKEHVGNREYSYLSHAADQTHHQCSHHEENVKTAQGYRCMTIVDTDRKLYAEQFGYEVHLGKLIPPTCTPKNNLLVGIPKGKAT